MTPDVLELTAQIAAVPSPTGEETAKSLLVQRLFATAGLAAERDAHGRRRRCDSGRHGRGPERQAADRRPHRHGLPDRHPIGDQAERRSIVGARVGDNSVAVAAAIKLAELLRTAGEVLAVDVLVTGNVGEEGLGNLRGIREVLASRSDIGAVVALEGHNLGRVTHVAVGSRRFRVTVEGPGGHSWGDFGRPNAIHGLSRLIAELDAIPLPRSPKTTLNVGMISGGVSVNTIAPEASCLLDLRSIDESALRRLSDRVTRLVERSNRGDAVVYAAESIGERPAGVVSADSPIVQIAAETLSALGLEPSFDASSTDANVAIAARIPAVCIGLTTGGNVHRTDEFIDLEPVSKGVAQLALLTLALAESLSVRAL